MEAWILIGYYVVIFILAVILRCMRVSYGKGFLRCYGWAKRWHSIVFDILAFLSFFGVDFVVLFNKGYVGFVTLLLLFFVGFVITVILFYGILLNIKN